MSSPAQNCPLIIPEVSLHVRGDKVCGPENVVYSTHPCLALDEQGAQFFVKGEEDARIVVAEVVSHVIAGLVRIPVPSYAIGRFNGSGPAVFASAVVDEAIREISPWLKRRKIANMDMLPKLIVLDVWLANNDRNLGNLLGKSNGDDGSNLDLIAIDFEKAAVVRKKSPSIEIPTMPAKGFWPTGELGTECKKQLQWNPRMFEDFAKVTDQEVEHLVKASVAAVGNAEIDPETISHVLNRRKTKLVNLVREVWN